MSELSSVQFVPIYTLSLYRRNWNDPACPS